MSFDALFKQLFKRLFRERQIEVKSDIPVGKLPLKIDIVFIRENNQSLKGVWGQFEKYAKKYDVIEFKSERDKSSELTIHKLRAYMCYFWESQEIGLNAEKNTVGWLLSSRKLHWLSRHIKNNIFKQLEAGLYQYIPSWLIYVIVINELELTEENYPFLVFSTGKKLESFIKKVYIEEQEDYKAVVYYLHNNIVMSMSEAKQIPQVDPEENIRRAINYLGLEKFLKALTPEEKEKAIKILKEE